MTVIRLRYIDRFRDRHGKLRYYFRRPGGQRTPLPGQPGSREFRTAYEAALAEAPAAIDTRKQSAAFSFDWLLPRYFNSMRYLGLGRKRNAPTGSSLNALSVRKTLAIDL